MVVNQGFVPLPRSSQRTALWLVTVTLSAASASRARHLFVR
jgi:hypothetical protein